MIKNSKQFCLISTFKENYFLLELFFNFYFRFYGIKNYLFFCGLPESRSHKNLVFFFKSKLSLKNLCKQKAYYTSNGRQLLVNCVSTETVKIYIVSYKASENISEEDFHYLKNELFQWASFFLPKIFKRFLVVDNDEFLRCSRPSIIENNSSACFHFVEFIPTKTWPPENLVFSLQGWYYRRQVFPLFRLGGHLSFQICNLFGRGINHSGCKTFYFSRKHLAKNKSWRHGAALCAACNFVSRNIKELQFSTHFLKNYNIAYHLANVTKKQFLKEKLLLFRRLQTDKLKGQTNDVGQSPEVGNLKLASYTFTRYIKNSIFPCVKDNFLLSFFDKPQNLVLK